MFTSPGSRAGRSPRSGKKQKASDVLLPFVQNSWLTGKAPALLQRSQPRFMTPEMFMAQDVQIIYAPGGNPTSYSGSTDFSAAFDAMHAELLLQKYDNEWPASGGASLDRYRQKTAIALQPGQRYRVSRSVPMWGLDARGYLFEGNGARLVLDYAGGKAGLDLLGSSGWVINNLGIESDDGNIPDVLCLIGIPATARSCPDMAFNNCYFDGWANKAGLYNAGSENSRWYGGSIQVRAASGKAVPALWIDSLNTLDVSTLSNCTGITWSSGTNVTCVQHYVGATEMRGQSAGTPGVVRGAVCLYGSTAGDAATTQKIHLEDVYMTCATSTSDENPAIVIKGDVREVKANMHGEVHSSLVYFDVGWGNYNQRGLMISDHNANPTNAILETSDASKTVNIFGADISIWKNTGGTSKLFGANMALSTVTGRIRLGDTGANLRNFSAIARFEGDIEAFLDLNNFGGLSASSRARVLTLSSADAARGGLKLGVSTIVANATVAGQDRDIFRFAGGSVTAVTFTAANGRYAAFDIINDQAVSVTVSGFQNGAIKMLPGDIIHAVQHNVSLFAQSLVDGGTYTPTLTAGVNLDSAAVAAGAIFTRVNNIGHASMQLTIDPTAGASTTTSGEISLPVASNLAASTDLQGRMTNRLTTQIGSIIGSAANDTAAWSFPATNTASIAWQIDFDYIIK